MPTGGEPETNMGEWLEEGNEPKRHLCLKNIYHININISINITSDKSAATRKTVACARYE